MTSPASRTSQFVYLLNAMEHASAKDNPAMHGYAEKRKAVLDYVAALETRSESGAQLPRAVGVSREFGNKRALLISFERELSDDELRALHDLLAGRTSASADVLIEDPGHRTPGGKSKRAEREGQG